VDRAPLSREPEFAPAELITGLSTSGAKTGRHRENGQAAGLPRKRAYARGWWCRSLRPCRVRLCRTELAVEELSLAIYRTTSRHRCSGRRWQLSAALGQMLAEQLVEGDFLLGASGSRRRRNTAGSVELRLANRR